MSELGLLPIDIPTLALSRGLMQMMLAGLLIYVGSQQARSISARLWAAGLLLNGLALFLFVVVAPTSWDAAMTAANHIAIALGGVCVLQGFWRFNDQPSRKGILATIFVFLILTLIAWDFIWPNARLRVLGSATGQALYLFALQQALRVPPRQEVMHIYLRLRWVVIVYLLIFVWSYASLADVLPVTAQLDKGYHRSFFSVASLLFMLALAVSCLALKFAVLAARNSDLAMTDWLTGLLNRRGFFLAVERDRVRHTDVKQCRSIVAIDIDHFKQINDDHGHAAGDEVLKVLANLLRQWIAKNNHIARTGGEEFCILLPGTELNDARQLGELVRSQCEQTRVEINGSKTIKFTISAGVSQVARAETIDQALNRADHALYVAKRDGRNRVVESVLESLDGLAAIRAS